MLLTTMIRKKYTNYKNLNNNRITRMGMSMMMIRIRIRIIRKKLRRIIRVNIIITIKMKIARVARMIMRMKIGRAHV